ncbi:MAG: GrpB family protein [Verrucomicrobiota bacterium]
MRILPYFSRLAEFRVYDAKVAHVARNLCEAIETIAPELRVEHVGSTSVPGCGGKGIVDLAILYPDDFLARARATLDDLGFQKQGGREPFPESRPMRVGCVELEGQSFRIHAHVIALGSEEHQELVWFREALRVSSDLRHGYENRKLAILASGIQDSIEYCKAKGVFITEALTEEQF